jgi:4-hydroxy-3-methylbut-2-enyl diphosphate reductase IspH
VLLAEPRGFCAGVEMAIKALAWMVRAFEPPVYCYHEIVHNRLVVERFREQGVVFVDDVSEVPPARRSCSRPTARRPRWSRPPAPRTATS